MNDEPTNRHEGRLVALVLVFLGLTLSVQLGRVPLMHEEGKRTLIAQEMLVSGDWVTPTLYGFPYLRKPPGHNWAIAVVSIPFGRVTRFSARFVSLLSHLSIALGVWWLVRKYRPEAAFAAFLIAVTNYLMLAEFAILAEIDMLFAASVFWSVFAYLYRPGRWWAVLLSALLMGYGVLIKGFAPLFVYPPLLVFALSGREGRGKRIATLAAHALLSLIPPALWLALYVSEHGLSDLLAEYAYEMSYRNEGNFGEWVVHLIRYPVEIAVVLLPWPLVLLLSRRRVRDRDWFYRATAIAFFAPFAFWALLPGSEERYLLPAFPFFAIWAGTHIELNRSVKPWVRKTLFSFTAALALAAAVYFALAGSTLPAVNCAVVAAAAAGFAFVRLDLRGAMIALIALFVLAHQHGLILQRVEIRYSHKAAAETVAARIVEDIPVLVHGDVSFREGTHISGLLHRPLINRRRVLDGPLAGELREFYYVTPPRFIFIDQPVLAVHPHPEKVENTLVLQRVTR